VERPASLAVCLKSHAEIVRHAGTTAHTETCPFGLTETAVTVRLGEETIGFLRIGQVLRCSAIQPDKLRAAAKVAECGIPFTGGIRKAWEATLIIPNDRCGATVRLLTFFAEQLSALINQIVIEKPNVPGGNDPSPFATGPIEPPDPTERGFKDTVKANPGYFTRIRAKFDLPMGVTPPQDYVHRAEPHVPAAALLGEIMQPDAI
jgi:hypothetical protein